MNEPATFANLVQSALAKAVTPEAVQAKVDEHVSRLVDEAIRDAMGSWSDTGKTVKNAVKESLQVNKLDLPSYGRAVQDILQRQIQARVSEVVAAKLAEDMEGLLCLAPKRAKLSELIAAILKDKDDDCSCGPDEIWLDVEWTDYRSVHVHIHPDGDPRGQHNADIRFSVSLPKKHDEYAFGEVPEGAIYSGTVRGTDLKKDVTFGFGTNHAKGRTEFGRWFALEQKLLAMYAVGTVIELDEGNCVLSRHDW